MLSTAFLRLIQGDYWKDRARFGDIAFRVSLGKGRADSNTAVRLWMGYHRLAQMKPSISEGTHLQLELIKQRPRLSPLHYLILSECSEIPAPRAVTHLRATLI